MKKRYYVVYDIGDDLFCQRRILANSRKHVFQIMRTVYGDGVKIRIVESGF